MAVSDVSICNIALTMLSSSRILSLSQDSENARKCNAIYENTRDSLIESHNWNFARRQAELSLLDEDPVLDDWLYIYQIPTLPYCLRVIRLEGDDKFAIYGRKLYTNVDTAKIEYIARITDPSEFSSLFVKCLSSKLALELSYGITQSNTEVQRMSELFKSYYDEAKWSDSQEGSGIIRLSGSFLDSRNK